jgi:predicted tellurium resistance membrane protein TerC
LEALLTAENTMAWGIEDKLEGEIEPGKRVFASSVGSVILAIMTLGIVFTLDSAITAVGLANENCVRVSAIVISVGGMLVFAETMRRFIEEHPTMKTLALAFLILIGVVLTLEGLEPHVQKGDIYFAMAFPLAVEMVNLGVR